MPFYWGREVFKKCEFPEEAKEDFGAEEFYHFYGYHMIDESPISED